MDFELDIEPVFEKELYTTPPLMRVIAATLCGSKQDIPKAFNLTKDLCSTTDLKHLRRIRDLDDGCIQCIICRLTNDSDADETIKSLENKFETTGLFKDFCLREVSSKAPKTKQQWAACSKLWPCKYAKSNYLINCLQGNAFNSAERLVLKIIVDQVLEESKSNSSSQSTAVIFRYNKVYGVGSSNHDIIGANPTKHSSMVAVDAVANYSGGGHWTPEEEARTLGKIIQQRLDVQHELQDHTIDSKFLPYLCTDYDVLITEEPCMMCTMGLVQSRIRRLFYLDCKSVSPITGSLRRCCYDDGAIERFMVHRDKNLNHRFEAWRIKLLLKPP